MRTAIVYYSLSGVTKRVCEIISEKLDAELIRIEEKKKRTKVSAYIPGCPQAIANKCTKIKPFNAEISAFERVIIASPVWAGNNVPAINTFIKDNDIAGKEIFIVLTLGGDSFKTALDSITEKIEKKGGKLINSICICNTMKGADIEKETEKKIKDFIL